MPIDDERLRCFSLAGVQEDVLNTVLNRFDIYNVSVALDDLVDYSPKIDARVFRDTTRRGECLQHRRRDLADLELLQSP
jgi:hypothetical protein